MDLREQYKRNENKPINRHPWELARLQVVIDKISKEIDVNKPQTILDIGSGDTFVVENLSDKFPNITFFAIDIEFDDTLLKYYKNKLKNKPIYVFQSLDTAEEEMLNSEVSMILLLDVVEHIEDDVLFLNQLYDRPFFKKNTKLFITVPAYKSLFTSHDVFLGHYKRYSNRTLKMILQKSNYYPIKIGYFFTSLLPIRMLEKLKEKILKKDKKTTGLVTYTGGKFKTQLLKQLLLLDYKISLFTRQIGIKLPGLSNYIICKK